MCESSVCSSDLNITARVPSQHEAGKEKVGGEPLENWVSLGHAPMKGWFLRCLEALRRAPLGTRNGLPEVKPEQCIPRPTGQPWATEVWKAPLAVTVKGQSGGAR